MQDANEVGSVEAGGDIDDWEDTLPREQDVDHDKPGADD